MTNEELKQLVLEILPEATVEDAPVPGPGWITAHIEPAVWGDFARKLRAHPTGRFDYLFCLTCVDWKTHLGMVYHLTSTLHRQTLVVKSKLDRERPEIETVSSVWKTAEFHEREVYEMFGVQFRGHPDLRLLILPDGWEGKYPLRKDFEDPVNMIRL